MERRPLTPYKPVVARRPLGPYRPVYTYPGHLPKDQWPERVYGYHPYYNGLIICVCRDQPGYFEVSPEIDPLARNRMMGIMQELAEAVIAAAWSPGGHVWKR